MQDTHGFSLYTAKHAEQWRPERRFSDKFTDEDIDRMLRNAAEKVGAFDADKVQRMHVEEENSRKLSEARKNIEEEYCRKLCAMEKLYFVKFFWFGVLQGIVASFLFVLAGYIILKMNGSWDILLNNLFK